MKHDALRRLAEGAAPFGFRIERTPFSELPDLVLLRPEDGLDVARLPFFDDPPDEPVIRSIFLHSVSREEQAEIEAHMSRGLLPLIAELFSYPLWLSLGIRRKENDPRLAMRARVPPLPKGEGDRGGGPWSAGREGQGVRTTRRTERGIKKRRATAIPLPSPER